MAPDEAAAATTPLEVATHFPGSSGIRLPTDQTIGIDASKLFDVIARMGGAIAKLQDDLRTPPPWVADVSEKLKRMDKLDQGFSSLTDVVGDLMSVTNVQNDQIEAVVSLRSRRSVQPSLRETVTGYDVRVQE